MPVIDDTVQHLFDELIIYINSEIKPLVAKQICLSGVLDNGVLYEIGRITVRIHIENDTIKIRLMLLDNTFVMRTEKSINLYNPNLRSILLMYVMRIYNENHTNLIATE